MASEVGMAGRLSIDKSNFAPTTEWNELGSHDRTYSL